MAMTRGGNDDQRVDTQRVHQGSGGGRRDVRRGARFRSQDGGSSCDAADVKPASPGTALDQKAVEAEMCRRAELHLPQRRLVVDYYRIGRKLAYPLPLKSLSVPDVPVPGIPGYPWSTWLSWTLEERILALGWVAEWFEDKKPGTRRRQIWRPWRIGRSTEKASIRLTRDAFSGRLPPAGNGWETTCGASCAKRAAATWRVVCRPPTSCLARRRPRTTSSVATRLMPGCTTSA